MTRKERERRALQTLAEAGIELDNSRPDSGPRRWFAGPSSPSIVGLNDLEVVAHYVGLAVEQTIRRSDGQRFGG